ncbi:DUF4921 family protein [Schaalia sp. lx-260]|uniref:DUF4921 family protein n=1 Tax=Schaalia sp. lx-260 TaxID=2899082 RepID=UPI001E5CA91E|nr:DUF4921 family protein [Schaalia sp. lx-260]MCD4548858.1 DUF4921 family protein [Schaalia sp. lx-260]
MATPHPSTDSAIQRLPDGTVKQRNLLTGTEVWTVPGRGNRPLSTASSKPDPIDHSSDGHHCAFCSERYLETPPEKSRRIRLDDGTWQELAGLPAEELATTTAEFRRIPNLFEIVSYNYWHMNYGHVPSEEQHRRMAQYLASSRGYDHVMQVVGARMKATGMSDEDLALLTDSDLLRQANGFFSGGHDLIIGRRHYIDGADDTSQLASSGTLTPEEHYQYTDFTIRAMQDLYHLNSNVRYVAAFQNWLKPAGASFDHLHKQLVAIDDHAVQTQAEADRLRHDPLIYDEILKVAATRKLLVAQNDHAVAIVGFGHRFPGLAVWPLHAPRNPWECDDEVIRAVSDLLHAVHAATGAEVACNEEWYHRPPDVDVPLRWRILLKWRLSTVAGFEGGTRIYLNTLDPWTVADRVIPRLLEMRDSGVIAPMRIGEECRVSPDLLRN